MTRTESAPRTNRLIERLPRGPRQRVLAQCDCVDLAAGQALTRAGGPIAYVYFPTTGCVSLVAEREPGPCLELALIGDEGMVGFPLALGIGVSPVLARVCGEGGALRLSARRFAGLLAAEGSLRRTMQRYLFVLMAQLGQSARCTRFHVVEQRVARALLATSDRAHSPSFHVTHEVLAGALGVRRAGITRAATSLQARKLIRYARGDISICDRPGLEAASCGCYREARDTYERVMRR